MFQQPLPKNRFDSTHMNNNKGLFFWQGVLMKGGTPMAVHHGGKVGKAATILAKKTSTKPAKRRAGGILAAHKAKCH